MSKIDNLALTLYNKDRHQLMKLYNNKKTSQLRKDIIREIFNQEGGEPFLTRIIDDEGNISFKKDITNEKLNEVKYISYIITHDEYINPYNKYRKINVSEEDFYSDDLINLENSFLDNIDEIIANNNSIIDYDIINELEQIKSLYISGRTDIDSGNLININYIITFGIIKFDDNIYVVGYRKFNYTHKFFFNKKFNIKFVYSYSYINIDDNFKGLSICKNLYYNNISIFINDLYMFVGIKFFYIWIEPEYSNYDGAFACYDNSFRKLGFNYRLTIDQYDIDLGIIAIKNTYNNFEYTDNLSHDPYNTVLYFKDLSDLIDTALKNYTLLKINIEYNEVKWYEELYTYILVDDFKPPLYYKEPWYYNSTNIEFNEDKTISETNFIEFAGKINPKYIKIKSIIIPTNIYETKNNDIYILINKLENLAKFDSIIYEN